VPKDTSSRKEIIYSSLSLRSIQGKPTLVVKAWGKHPKTDRSTVVAKKIEWKVMNPRQKEQSIRFEWPCKDFDFRK
jgi:hypothetical protein